MPPPPRGAEQTRKENREMRDRELEWHDRDAAQHVQEFLERRYGVGRVHITKSGFETYDKRTQERIRGDLSLHYLRFDPDLSVQIPGSSKLMEIKTISPRYGRFSIPHDGWVTAFSENVGLRANDRECLHRFAFYTFVTRDPSNPNRPGGIYACWPDQIPDPVEIKLGRKPPADGWPVVWQDVYARLAAQYKDTKTKIDLQPAYKDWDTNAFFLIPPYPQRFTPGKSPDYLVPLGVFLDRIEQQRGTVEPVWTPLRPSRKLLNPPDDKTFMLTNIVLPSQWTPAARRIWESVPRTEAEAATAATICERAKVGDSTFS